MALASRDQYGLVNADMARHIPVIGSALASRKGPIRQPDDQELSHLIGVKPLTFVDYL